MKVVIGDPSMLMLTPVAKESGLQEKAIENNPVKNRASVVFDVPIAPEPRGFWEKGSFVDYYV